MISVVLPARNSERTIAAAVMSTLAFLPADAELLVHSDGSTDGTESVLRAIRDARLSVTSDTRQQGVARSLNALIARSQHEWIARMDADDLTLPGRFAAQLKTGNEGYDLVFGHRINFGARPGALRQTKGVRLEPDTLRLLLLFENPLIHPTLLARRSALLVDGGYRPGPAEDYDLWLRLQLTSTRIVSIARPVIAYRRHQKQVTQGKLYSSRFKADPQLAMNYRALVRQIGAPDFLLGTNGTPLLNELSESHLVELKTFLDAEASRIGPAQRHIVIKHLKEAIARPHHVVRDQPI